MPREKASVKVRMLKDVAAVNVRTGKQQKLKTGKIYWISKDEARALCSPVICGGSPCARRIRQRRA